MDGASGNFSETAPRITSFQSAVGRQGYTLDKEGALVAFSSRGGDIVHLNRDQAVGLAGALLRTYRPDQDAPLKADPEPVNYGAFELQTKITGGVVWVGIRQTHPQGQWSYLKDGEALNLGNELLERFAPDKNREAFSPASSSRGR